MERKISDIIVINFITVLDEFTGILRVKYLWKLITVYIIFRWIWNGKQQNITWMKKYRWLKIFDLQGES